jgi:hypothetical protein
MPSTRVGTQLAKPGYTHASTTLARHLSDHYPSFKITLGQVVKNNTDLQGGTRDHRTLFETLILEPLKDLHIVGPILVVIDALDESGDTTGKTQQIFCAGNDNAGPALNICTKIMSSPTSYIQGR